MTLKTWTSEIAKLRRRLGLTPAADKPAVRAQIDALKARKPRRP